MQAVAERGNSEELHKIVRDATDAFERSKNISTIGNTKILFGFLNHPCKLFIRKGFRRNIILEAAGATSTAARADTASCAAAVCRGACTEQFRAVAVGQVVGIVPPGLLPVHVLPRDGIL